MLKKSVLNFDDTLDDFMFHCQEKHLRFKTMISSRI